MIKSIYIMKDNGVLLYSKKMGKEKFEDNLLIGFFTSTAHFSREALNSLVKNVDLGAGNKLILVASREEKLLCAAIVNTMDDNELVNVILNNILQDFINSFSPDYTPQDIDITETDNYVKENLQGRVIPGNLRRVIYTLVAIVPLSFLMVFLSAMVAGFFIEFFELEETIYTEEELFSVFMQITFIISSLVLLITFPLPNLILGYLSGEKRLMVVNSLIYFGFVMLMCVFFSDQVFISAYLTNLPPAIIVSLFFASIGLRISNKRKLNIE